MKIFYNTVTEWHNHRDTTYYYLYTSEQDRDADYDNIDRYSREQVTKGEWDDMCYQNIAYSMLFNPTYIFRTKFTDEQQKEVDKAIEIFKNNNFFKDFI